MQAEDDDIIAPNLDAMGGTGDHLARQLDFDDESFPFDSQRHETGSSHQLNSYQYTSKEVTVDSPPVVHTRPTPTTAHKVTMVQLL